MGLRRSHLGRVQPAPAVQPARTRNRLRQRQPRRRQRRFVQLRQPRDQRTQRTGAVLLGMRQSPFRRRQAGRDQLRTTAADLHRFGNSEVRRHHGKRLHGSQPVETEPRPYQGRLRTGDRLPRRRQTRRSRTTPAAGDARCTGRSQDRDRKDQLHLRRRYRCDLRPDVPAESPGTQAQPRRRTDPVRQRHLRTQLHRRARRRHRVDPAENPAGRAENTRDGRGRKEDLALGSDLRT